MKGKSERTVRLIAAALSRRQTHEDHRQASAPAKPRRCSHFPPPLLLGTALAQNATPHAEASGLGTNRDFKGAGFTGQ